MAEALAWRRAETNVVAKSSRRPILPVNSAGDLQDNADLPNEEALVSGNKSVLAEAAKAVNIFHVGAAPDANEDVAVEALSGVLGNAEPGQQPLNDRDLVQDVLTTAVFRNQPSSDFGAVTGGTLTNAAELRAPLL